MSLLGAFDPKETAKTTDPAGRLEEGREQYKKELEQQRIDQEGPKMVSLVATAILQNLAEKYESNTGAEKVRALTEYAELLKSIMDDAIEQTGGNMPMLFQGWRSYLKDQDINAFIHSLSSGIISFDTKTKITMSNTSKAALGALIAAIKREEII